MIDFGAIFKMLFEPEKFENPGQAIAEVAGVTPDKIGGQLMAGLGTDLAPGPTGLPDLGGVVRGLGGRA